MDYEKKIKNALSDKSVPFEVQAWLEEQFPELKENEDKDILNAIAEGVQYCEKEFGMSTFGGMPINTILAWIEKQGEQTLSQNNERAWLYLVSDVLTWRNGIGQYLDDPKVQELAKKLCNEYAQKLTMQKSAKNIAETWKEMRLEVYQQASGNRHEPNCSDDTTKMFSLNDIDEIIEKMSEQKPANKVKPKFDIGDWVIDKQGIVHQIANVIENVTNHIFCYQIVGGGYFNDNAEGVRLWAITDAKDGDVLTTDTWTFIFKKYQDKSVYFHCAVSTFNEFSISDTGNFDSNYIHPASKEQRDKFFAQMKNAGCEWDAEKKELKKIMED